MKTKPVTGRVRLARLRNALRVMEWVAEKPPTAYDIGIEFEKYPDAEGFASDQCCAIDEVPACKTIACTAGWLGTDPWFRKRGFVTTREGEIRLHQRSVWEGQFHEAPGEFLGLSDDEARQLFWSGPDDDKTAKAPEIAAYLRALIAKYASTRAKKGRKAK